MEIEIPLTPEIWSAIAAICSLVVSIIVYRFDKKKEKAKIKSDLYAMVVHLSGFVNYVTVLYNYHNIDNITVVQGIINKILNVDKTILDSKDEFYYNSDFDSEILSKVECFFAQYMGWKAFDITTREEIFLESQNLYMLQLLALNILKYIREYYINDEKINEIISPILKDYDKIKKDSDKFMRNIQYIGDNLRLILSSERMQDELLESLGFDSEYWPILRDRIIDQCFKIILIDSIQDNIYKNAKSFLFNKNIVDIIRNEGCGWCFRTTTNELISWSEIYCFLWSLNGSIITERLRNSSN